MPTVLLTRANGHIGSHTWVALEASSGHAAPYSITTPQAGDIAVC